MLTAAEQTKFVVDGLALITSIVVSSLQKQIGVLGQAFVKVTVQPEAAMPAANLLLLLHQQIDRYCG